MQFQTSVVVHFNSFLSFMCTFYHGNNNLTSIPVVYNKKRGPSPVLNALSQSPYLRIYHSVLATVGTHQRYATSFHAALWRIRCRDHATPFV